VTNTQYPPRDFASYPLPGPEELELGGLISLSDRIGLVLRPCEGQQNLMAAADGIDGGPSTAPSIRHPPAAGNANSRGCTRSQVRILAPFREDVLEGAGVTPEIFGEADGGHDLGGGKTLKTFRNNRHD